MRELIVTLDIDWACEEAIERTLNFLFSQNIRPTIFTTHNSQVVKQVLSQCEVGLHPYFGADSSHGNSIPEVIKNVLSLPHNFLGFRCHRFASCNASKQALAEAGMVLSSNVCTDLEVVSPFKDRYGFLEVPVFLEDGGYLWRGHPLELNAALEKKIDMPGKKVLIIHPMHFVVNTPHFEYMRQIKKKTGRKKWLFMTGKEINELQWKGRGIRDLLIDILKLGTYSSLKSLLTG